MGFAEGVDDEAGDASVVEHGECCGVDLFFGDGRAGSADEIAAAMLVALCLHLLVVEELLATVDRFSSKIVLRVG